jgi:hypothetical protein
MRFELLEVEDEQAAMVAHAESSKAAQQLTVRRWVSSSRQGRATRPTPKQHYHTRKHKQSTQRQH